MTDIPDREVLAEFARSESESAFAELVRRHIALVYSVALRHTDNPQHAQEITQAVFIILARKAASLGRGTVLSGWLFHTTRLTAANFKRAEFRRIRREQEVFMQSTIDENSTNAAWQELAPLLDDAMAHLGATDRDAVVLRYFENKSLSEVGVALGMEERAAQKRVGRALEKLRRIFTKRGVTLTTAVIAGAVTANSVQAAPVGLAATVTVVAAKGAVVSGSTLTLIKGVLKVMAWAKIKTVTVASLVVLAPGAFIILLANNLETEAPSLGVSPPGNIQNKAVDSEPLQTHPSVPTYVLTDIGPMPGFDSSTATDINNQGQVIGWMDGSNGVVHAFIWDQGSATDLGTFGGSRAILTGINNRGEIVGVVLTNGERRAFMLQGTNQTDLGVIDGYAHLGTEGNISYTPGGLSINDKSQISGRITVKDADNQRSFIHTQGQTSYFGLRGDGSICYAHAMNNRGQITGISLWARGNPNYGVFLWQDGEITELKTLGGPRAYPSAINDQGTVVGWANPANTTNNQSHALLWEAGQMFDLNSAAGWKNSSAAGINNAGEVVGWATTTNNHTFAFLKHGDAILDINDLVETNAGWHLVSANSINDRGQILVRGIKGKLSQVFLVSPASLSSFAATKPEIATVQLSAAIASTTPFNLTTFERLPNGAFRLAFAGTPDGAYSVEASTNLTTWTLLGPALNENGNVTFTDMDVDKYTMRFYRAVLTFAPTR